jgi:translation initiation factor IF-2
VPEKEILISKETVGESAKEQIQTKAQPKSKSTVKTEPKEKISKKPQKAKTTEAKPEEKTVKLKSKPSKKKKAKREVPAKIIKLPSKTVEKETEAEETGEKDSAQVVTSAEAEHFKAETAESKLSTHKDHAKEGKKKKHIAEAEEPDKDKKFFKKKISFRRKEVVEGKDLYSDDKRGRKVKKTAKAKAVKGHKTQITTPKAIKRRIKIDDAIMLSQLARRMGIKASDMISKLMSLGVMATVNQTIDYDTAALVAGEFGYEVERASFEEEAILKAQKEEAKDSEKHQVTRPPVVTIMGHVDHGKTSLLDVIRKTHITEAEAGGITQHIGAYYVETEKGQIVFLDTPGHEAFTAMRARGAQVTDIVVLVVAADDGVMPQTTEAINHARASNVPIIVAVNKIDKNNAEPERVQRQLAEQGLTPEEWGGDTIFVKVSAKKNKGINDLLEMILLQAEISELQANADKLAVGNVIEAKLDSGRGPVATVLVKEGTLHAGDPVVCGIHYGKVRAMLNDRGQNVDAAGPSIPVEILGLSGVPQAGDELVALSDEKDAKQVSSHRQQKQRSVELAKTSRLSLEKLYEKMQEEEIKELNLIIKADVHGSIEALKDSLVKLSNEEVKINVVHAATGTITESDISLAAVSNAIIIGFNVRPTPKVVEYANEEHVDIRFYNVIYNAIKEVKDAIVGMMSSTYEERILGRAEVRESFHVPKVGTIAGCYVTEGKVERGKPVRLVRDGVVIFEGKISSLKRYKDDFKEVQSGYECGIGVENYNDIKIGDIIECFYLEEIKPEL